MKESTSFGISENSLTVLPEVLALESFYGLPRLFTEYAVRLCRKTNRTLEDCIRYANSLYIACGVFCESLGDDEQMQTVFFSRNIPVSLIIELREKYCASIDDLMKCDMNMLKMFPGFERAYSMQFKYYVRAYEYYASHLPVREDDPWFNEYLDEIMVGNPFETALEIAYPDALWDDDELDDFEDLDFSLIDTPKAEEEDRRYMYYEDYAVEEERWHGRSLDSDLFYDCDNAFYFDNDYEEYGFHEEQY